MCFSKKIINLIFLISLILFSSCSYILKPKKENIKIEDVKIALNNATEKDYDEIVSTASNSWFYGQGLGETALNVGTIVAFPPYALFLLGNTALDFAGYEKIGVSTVLPEDAKKTWSKSYDEVLSVPGRITAAVSKEEYVDREEANRKLISIINNIKSRNSKYVGNYSKENYLQAERDYWFN